MRGKALYRIVEGNAHIGLDKVILVVKIFIKNYFCTFTRRNYGQRLIPQYRKIALEQDGWLISHDPYPLQNWNPEWEIDFGAEKLIAAERGLDKIAVEVKSFTADSFAYEFHRVLGQFMNYKAGLEVLDPDRLLFIAVPEPVYITEFQRKGIQISIDRYQVHIIVFDPSNKVIKLWLPEKK